MAPVRAVPVPVGAVPATAGHGTAPSGHLRLRAAPRLEPPYDDEASPPQPQQVERLWSDKPLPWPHEVDASAPDAPSRRRLPDPRPWAGQFLLVALETMDGRRPPAQLGQWATATAVAGVREASALCGVRPHTRNRPRTPAPVLHSVHVGEPTEGVAEVCAVVRSGARHRALATRLEWVEGCWRCVYLRLV